jgi:hypothetical protein
MNEVDVPEYRWSYSKTCFVLAVDKRKSVSVNHLPGDLHIFYFPKQDIVTLEIVYNKHIYIQINHPSYTKYQFSISKIPEDIRSQLMNDLHIFFFGKKSNLFI